MQMLQTLLNTNILGLQLKYILIIFLCLFVLFVIASLLLHKKSENYFGFYCEEGRFGESKTANAFFKAFKISSIKQKDKNSVIIANVPYPFVDIYYSNKNDLLKVFQYLNRYTDETNTDYLLQRDKYKNIYFIIDEADLYFNNYDKNKLPEPVYNTLKQVRKRNIDLCIISQFYSKVFKTLRDFCDYSVRNTSLRGGLIKKRHYREILKEEGDIYSDAGEGIAYYTIEKRYSLNFSILFKLYSFLNKYCFCKIDTDFVNYKYLTKFVVGLNNAFNMTYEDFYKILDPNKGKDINSI